MSARKGFETKIQDDENTDSGFLSGPISEQLTEEFDADAELSQRNRGREEAAPAPPECDQYEVCEEPLDSGVDLCMSFDGLRVQDATPTSARLPPTVYVTPEGPDIQLLNILFQQDDDGDTQLHIAAVQGCEKSVGVLVTVCPNKYLLDLPNDFGHTALHLAVMSGNAVVARMLVREGASLGIRDLNGDTPVHLATAAKGVDCLHALLAPLENQPPKRLSSVLNQKNYDGQTCIHVAANAGDRQKLQILAYYGADINARDGLAGWTALHIAARRGDVLLAEHLLQCSDVTVRTRDFAGRTPRRIAKRMRTFTSAEAQRLMASLPEDTDSEDESDDEYDSDGEAEALFDRLKGTMTVASLVTN